MGRIVSIIQFTGRVGSAVGSKGKGGKVLLRQYQPSVTNPRTPAQMSQRAKMKLAAYVATFTGAEEGEVVAKCILVRTLIFPTFRKCGTKVSRWRK